MGTRPLGCVLDMSASDDSDRDEEATETERHAVTHKPKRNTVRPSIRWQLNVIRRESGLLWSSDRSRRLFARKMLCVQNVRHSNIWVNLEYEPKVEKQQFTFQSSFTKIMMQTKTKRIFWALAHARAVTRVEYLVLFGGFLSAQPRPN